LSNIGVPGLRKTEEGSLQTIEKHLAVSEKIELSDLDWQEARRVGLSPAEARVLEFFADVEGQTIFYMLEVLKLKTARDPDTLAFATIWNYEEYFHSYAIMKLMAECGRPIDTRRVTHVRAAARLKAKLEDTVQVLMSKFFPKSFVALWMAWGASQEAMTAQGYDQIARQTQNPVLRTICRRIAKQERRHFAWYYNAARDHLGRSRFAQRFVRYVFEEFWAPVGGGVKSEEQIASMIADLFPDDTLVPVMTGIDDKMSRLPGMEGFDVTRRWAERVQSSLPTRVQTSELAAANS
jgi:hypothetical protein